MKTPRYQVKTEHDVNRSRFIGFLIKTESESEASDFLEKIKLEYPDATHHVFAYIIGSDGEAMKTSDDGEPVRTAGFPILEVMKKNDISDAMIIVVRYFGGIKLGSGGLIRAYSTTARKLLERAEFVTKTIVDDYMLEIGYSYTKALERYLDEHAIERKTEYGEKVIYRFSALQEKNNEISKFITDMTNGQAILKKTGFRYMYI